jgi:hypothetical protein
MCNVVRSMDWKGTRGVFCFLWWFSAPVGSRWGRLTADREKGELGEAMGVPRVGVRDTGDRPEGSGANGVESSISVCMLYAAGVSNDGLGVDNPRERADVREALGGGALTRFVDDGRCV